MLKIDAVALHDYSARSDKELSFKKGESLQVIEKTPDHNWWDGFHNGRRGFIPVAYIEILELKPVSAPPAATVIIPPRAPARKSSMPQETEEVATQSKVPSEPAILEEAEKEEPSVLVEGERDTKTPEVKIDSPVDQPVPPKREETPPPPSQEAKSTTPDVKKPTTPRSSGAVKAMTTKFQTQETQQQQQPRVLVEPRHRRQHSDHLRKSAPEGEGVTQRTHSTGSGGKVGMISSQFETKAVTAAPPPPIKPKPQHLHHPQSPIEPQPSGAFPIMAHPKPGSLPGASPLQQIALQSQVGQKPAQLKRPAPSKPVKTSSFKKKGKDDRAVTKPPPPAKPNPPPGIGSLRDKTAELNAEFQAKALARRRQAEDGPK